MIGTTPVQTRARSTAKLRGDMANVMPATKLLGFTVESAACLTDSVVADPIIFSGSGRAIALIFRDGLDILEAGTELSGLSPPSCSESRPFSDSVFDCFLTHVPHRFSCQMILDLRYPSFHLLPTVRAN